MNSEFEISLMFACQVEKWNTAKKTYELTKSPLNGLLITDQEIEFSGLTIRLEEHQFSISYKDKPIKGIAISEHRPDSTKTGVDWFDNLITGETILVGSDEFTITEIAPGEINPVQQLIITKPVKPTNPHPNRLVISQPQFIKEGNPGSMLL